MFGVVLSPGSALNNHTGSWRTETPEFVTLGAPCSVSCQAGESVREWITALQWGQEDKAYEAWASIIRANPLPATMGRICYAPCQKMCTRSALGGSLEIQSMERVLGDFGLDREWEAPTPDNLTRSGRLLLAQGHAGYLPHISCAKPDIRSLSLMPGHFPVGCCNTQSVKIGYQSRYCKPKSIVYFILE